MWMPELTNQSAGDMTGLTEVIGGAYTLIYCSFVQQASLVSTATVDTTGCLECWQSTSHSRIKLGNWTSDSACGNSPAWPFWI